MKNYFFPFHNIHHTLWTSCLLLSVTYFWGKVFFIAVQFVIFKTFWPKRRLMLFFTLSTPHYTWNLYGSHSFAAVIMPSIFNRIKGQGKTSTKAEGKNWTQNHKNPSNNHNKKTKDHSEKKLSKLVMKLCNTTFIKTTHNPQTFKVTALHGWRFGECQV